MPEHEEHAATVQGYAQLTEPADPKFDQILPFFTTLFSIMGLMFLSLWMDPRFMDRPGVTINEADLIESMIDGKLREKSQRIRQLEAELGI